MKEFPKTKLNQVNRLPQRAHYDTETIYNIIDEALICHVGIVDDGIPFVIPTIHARVGDMLYFHGALANRMLNHLKAGNQVCATMTLVDGIVFACSVFHHSMNYRSAMVFGKGRIVEDNDEKEKAFFAITEHIAKGRWNEVRKPNSKENNNTLIAGLQIESASAKVRTGPPIDDEEDYHLPIWAGVLPMQYKTLPPEKDLLLHDSVQVPEYIKNYKR